MALKPVPDELDRLINRVNCLPRERKGIHLYYKQFPVIPLNHWDIGNYTNLSQLQETCEQIMQVLEQYSGKDYPEFTIVTQVHGVRQVCMGVIRMKRFPSNPVDWNASRGALYYKHLFVRYRKTLMDFSRTCEELSEAKRVLHMIAGLGILHHPNNPMLQGWINMGLDPRQGILLDAQGNLPASIWVTSEGRLMDAQIKVLTNLAITSEGKLEVYPSPLMELLRGVEDIHRVRICQRAICRRIFWAGRSDASCCSTKCYQTNWKKNKSLTIDPEERRKKQREYKRQYRETLKKIGRRK